MNYEWQVKVSYLVERIGFGLFVFRNLSDGGREFVNCNGKTIKTTQATVSKEPLWLYVFESQDQLQQLLTEAENIGVKAPQTQRIEGELVATKTHLDDMRKLVFKPPQSTIKQTNNIKE